ncbi:unnamed protein product [Caenorhabditis angaria]|uniref:Uncharacterized protein n=1 Tax=Caenorhabditis angaria TaxID=860376 RepID=A0A9P1N8Q1_9PELO|nr:unnamed protein product [Caenorhabditis angaria]
MLLRKSVFFLLISSLSLNVFAQSIDEEESVSVGGGSDGSGNLITDDEDLEGSAIPPDRPYATTPQVRQKFSSSSTTTQRIQTTTTRKIITQSPVAPRIITSPKYNDSPSPFNMSLFFGTTGILIILGTIMLLLMVLILFILCFKARNNKKQAYRPGQRESPDALLKD